MADKKVNKIKYSEPGEYFPKEIRDKFNDKTSTKKTTKKKGAVKGTKKKK